MMAPQTWSDPVRGLENPRIRVEVRLWMWGGHRGSAQHLWESPGSWHQCPGIPTGRPLTAVAPGATVHSSRGSLQSPGSIQQLLPQIPQSACWGDTHAYLVPPLTLLVTNKVLTNASVTPAFPTPREASWSGGTKHPWLSRSQTGFSVALDCPPPPPRLKALSPHL
jgi:hypothetical protein